MAAAPELQSMRRRQLPADAPGLEGAAVAVAPASLPPMRLARRLMAEHRARLQGLPKGEAARLALDLLVQTAQPARTERTSGVGLEVAAERRILPAPAARAAPARAPVATPAPVAAERS